MILKQMEVWSYECFFYRRRPVRNLSEVGGAGAGDCHHHWLIKRMKWKELHLFSFAEFDNIIIIDENRFTDFVSCKIISTFLSV